jgi:hypothetical protein
VSMATCLRACPFSRAGSFPFRALRPPAFGRPRCDRSRSLRQR